MDQLAGNKRKKSFLIFQIVVCVLVCIVSAAFFCYKLAEMIASETPFTGIQQEGIARQIEGDNPVLNILQNIYLGRIPAAMLDIDALDFNSTVPPAVKQYMVDFKNFYRYSIEKEKGFTTSIDTMTFIFNSPVIKEYFKKDKKDESTARAAIVPYYFIRNINSKEKQKSQKSVYKAYIDNFVSGRVSLDRHSANVICLYVYAWYESVSKPLDYALLKEQIDRYLDAYKNDFSVNGAMSGQGAYLKTAREVLRIKPKSKGWLPQNRIQPFTRDNLL